MQTLHKSKPYRSKTIRDAARDVPHCMMCGKFNDGTIVGAHYTGIRQHEMGKGMGQKSADSYIAYLCHKCHTSMDQYHDENGADRSEKFLFAIVKSHNWLFQHYAKDSFGRWMEGIEDE